MNGEESLFLSRVTLALEGKNFKKKNYVFANRELSILISVTSAFRIENFHIFQDTHIFVLHCKRKKKYMSRIANKINKNL